MRRSLSILFGILVLFGFACTRHAAVTTPSTSHNPPPSPGTAVSQKDVKITIQTVGAACVILDPGDVYLDKGKDKIKWCVEYRCAAHGVMVVIDDFRDSKDIQKVIKRNPFEDHSDRFNTFDFGPLDPGGTDCTKVSGLATIKGHYYYRILVLGPDGTVLTWIDPGVIIGD